MRLSTLRERLIGRPRDHASLPARRSIALVAFFAWVGIGANALSSTAYGPEFAFRALGTHVHLGLFLALATAVTVFVIAASYNQVIELFPTGGGGYRAASELIAPRAGLVAGAALIVDYALTIAISTAAGVDALFSLLPAAWQPAKIEAALLLVGALLALNLRGAQPSLRLLLPVFLAFLGTHALLLLVGIGGRVEAMPTLLPDTLAATGALAQETSWLFVAAILLRAYSLGGATYAGIEAISNNVQTLAEPRLRTGRLTMLYMALALALTAGGILLLYQVRSTAPVEGDTLNAVAFGDVLHEMGFVGGSHLTALAIVLASEAALLFVAANSAFIGGPSMLANMANDSWVPHQFRYLSSRLVTQNGLLLMGIAAAVILLITRGSVAVLVVLYAINVFITFTLALAGLTRYWLQHPPASLRRWLARLALSLLGLAVCGGILVVTTVEKFFEGGWLTLAITGCVIAACLGIRRHYDALRVKLKTMEAQFEGVPYGSTTEAPPLDPEAPTAVFIVGSSRGGGMHALLRVQRLFPDVYKNFVFINARSVDAGAFGGQDRLEALKTEANAALSYFVQFCRSHGMAAKSYLVFGTDAVQELVTLAKRVQKDFPHAVFFVSKLVFEKENWITNLLHNQAALTLQRRLHLLNMQMIILPMRL
jgi:hypothetical protein